LRAWQATKAGRVLRALRPIGWTLKRQAGSHRILAREGWGDYLFAFHEGEEIGPRRLARIAKHTGLRPEDLRSRLFAQGSWPRQRPQAMAHLDSEKSG
jgi:predicted RNA binding protein YcfA (HicA-like mRNA interferase family)